MSWLFSRALVEACWPPNSSDGEPSAPLRMMPTAHPFLRNDRTMDASRFSRFGLTCEVLTASRGAELLTWYLAGFPVKTSAWPVKEQELEAQEAVFGNKWRALSVKYDPVSSSWKTVHNLFGEDLMSSSLTLPRLGSMRNGELYQHRTLERLINATASGLWVGTPTAAMSERSDKFAEGRTPNPRKLARWSTPTTMDALPAKSEKALLKEATSARPGRSRPANLRDQVVNQGRWPTPSATDGKRGGSITENMTGQSLTQVVNTPTRWPTPRSNDSQKRGNFDKENPRNGLPAAVRKFPSPSSRDWKDSPGMAKVATDGRNRNDQLARRVFAMEETPEDGGTLNPNWVEWLMGWCIGWTDLKPLATDRFQQWRQQHSEFYPGNDADNS